MGIYVMLVRHIAWCHHDISAIHQPYLCIKHFVEVGPTAVPSVTKWLTGGTSDLRWTSDIICQQDTPLATFNYRQAKRVRLVLLIHIWHHLWDIQRIFGMSRKRLAEMAV